MDILQELLDKHYNLSPENNTNNLVDLLEKTAEALESDSIDLDLREEDILAMAFVEADHIMKIAGLIDEDTE